MSISDHGLNVVGFPRVARCPVCGAAGSADCDKSVHSRVADETMAIGSRRLSPGNGCADYIYGLGSDLSSIGACFDPFGDWRDFLTWNLTMAALLQTAASRAVREYETRAAILLNLYDPVAIAAALAKEPATLRILWEESRK